MENINLMIIEILRNHIWAMGFITLFTCIVIGAVFSKLSKSNLGILWGFNIACCLIFSAIISMEKLSVPVKTCFSMVEQPFGNPVKWKETLEQDLIRETKSLEIAHKFKATNLAELEKNITHIQNKIVEAEASIKEYNTIDKKEYMVLAKISDTYTVMSQNGKVVSSFKFKLKKYGFEDNIQFNRCSQEIVSVANNLDLFAQK